MLCLLRCGASGCRAWFTKNGFQLTATKSLVSSLVALGSPAPHRKKMPGVAALAAPTGRTAALLLRAGALLLCAGGSAAQLNVPDAPTFVALDVLSGCACGFESYRCAMHAAPRRAHAPTPPHAPRRIISHAAPSHAGVLFRVSSLT